MPAGLSLGSRVSVLVPGGDAAEVRPPVVSGSVVAVEPPSVAGVSTVSLLLATDDALQVAAAGEVVLILEHPAGG
jgi:hypothetical protein